MGALLTTLLLNFSEAPLLGGEGGTPYTQESATLSTTTYVACNIQGVKGMLRGNTSQAFSGPQKTALTELCESDRVWRA